MRRTFAAAVLATLALVASASPASAHNVAGVRPSNFRTRLKEVVPSPPGLTVKVIDNGQQLEVTNEAAEEVVVLGYEGEPYLRIGRGGVWENTRSPAKYINIVMGMTPRIPSFADPKAPPSWDQIATENFARWHEHRIHWMGMQNPPQVVQAPGQEYVIIPKWSIPMLVGSTAVQATGDLTWVPGTSPLPWIVFALLLGAGALLLVVRGAKTSLLVGMTVALLVADLLHAIGVGLFASGTLLYRLGGMVNGNWLAIPAWGITALGLVLVIARKPAGLLFLAAANLLMAVEGGFSDINNLSLSQIPFAFSAIVVRALVAMSVGLGLALTAASVVMFARRPKAVTIGDTGFEPVYRSSHGGWGGW